MKIPETPKTPLVYILAASHSGSTLLTMLLSAHPEICSVGELKATHIGDSEQYLCSCKKKIKLCPFWETVRQDMSDRGVLFDITNAGTDIRDNATNYVHRLLSPLHRGVLLEKIRDIGLSFAPSWRKQLARVQHRNTNLIQCILAQSKTKVIIDSSKVAIRLKYLLRNPFLDVKIIRLVRDGRGVALTYMDPAHYADASEAHLRGGGINEGLNHKRLSIADASYQWRRSNEEATAILKSVDPSIWVEAQYEQLCSDTEQTLNHLFQFIGVNPQKAEKDYRSVEHHIVGNGMRLDSSSEIKLDERWKYELNDEDLRQFDDVAGDLNRSFGYK